MSPQPGRTDTQTAKNPENEAPRPFFAAPSPVLGQHHQAEGVGTGQQKRLVEPIIVRLEKPIADRRQEQEHVNRHGRRAIASALCGVCDSRRRLLEEADEYNESKDQQHNGDGYHKQRGGGPQQDGGKHDRQYDCDDPKSHAVHTFPSLAHPPRQGGWPIICAMFCGCRCLQRRAKRLESNSLFPSFELGNNNTIHTIFCIYIVKAFWLFVTAKSPRRALNPGPPPAPPPSPPREGR